MQKPKVAKVIDADGHIYENHDEIEEYFEGKHRGMRRARAYPLFPSLDGWPRGLGAGRPEAFTTERTESAPPPSSSPAWGEERGGGSCKERKGYKAAARFIAS